MLLAAATTGLAVKNLSTLKTNKPRAIRFSIPNCAPEDLLEFVPDEDSEPWKLLLQMYNTGLAVGFEAGFLDDVIEIAAAVDLFEDKFRIGFVGRN
jgi:hypothetical protein